MLQVRVFHHPSMFTIEREINNWLNQNRKIRICQITHAGSPSGWSAMILYEE